MVNSKGWMRAFFAVMLFVVLLVLVIVPLVLIWALNALFGLNIQYTLTTWFAALIIILILGWHKIVPMRGYYAMYGNPWKNKTWNDRPKRRSNR